MDSYRMANYNLNSYKQLGLYKILVNFIIVALLAGG